MGWGMANNVRRKMPRTATLFINDVSMDVCDRFVKAAAEHGPVVPVKTAKEAAERSNNLISIVPGPNNVREVYLDSANGVIAASPNEKRLMLECSTIDAQTTREVGTALMDKGLGTYVDTPVSARLHCQPRIKPSPR